MTARFTPLEPAVLQRDQAGIPFSARHQDVYHSRQGALEQARHVFLQGNGLPERWRGRDTFTVCETGFGLGRNFLALWQAWKNDPQRCARLHMLSFEAHPFSAADLTLASDELPADLRAAANELIKAWPPLLPGVHRLEFEQGRLTLTLFFGRIEQTAYEAKAGVDAYFLDGFAPSRNPEMWSRSLFGQLVRLARPGATAATWCASGSVRRAMRDSGFIVSAAPGFAFKREMTKAVVRDGLGWGTQPAQSGPALVVGAGPAGAAIAHALALRGTQVLIADPTLAKGLGASHRGHLAAALSPTISRDDDRRARLSRAGVLRAIQRWQALAEDARPRRVGTIELLLDDNQQAQRMETLRTLCFPSEWVHYLSAKEVSERAGIKLARPGLFFADGQLVQPEPLLGALLDHSLIRCLPASIRHLKAEQHGWLAHTEDGHTVEAATVVLANSIQARELLSTCFDLSAVPRLRDGWRVAGQISYFEPSDERYDSATILSGEGYWLPQVSGVNVAGSTYTVGGESSQVTQRGHHDIVKQVGSMLEVDPKSVGSWLTQPAGWAGWRAVVAGRLPMFGPVPGKQGLWLACAFGSRGLTWAPLAADLLGASLYGEPQPLERTLQRAVLPR